MYADDHRLEAEVSQHRWPLLEVSLPAKQQISAFCNQICRFDFDIETVTDVPISACCIATDQPELVSVYEDDGNSSWNTVACCSTPSGSKYGVFLLSKSTLAHGQKRR